MDSKMIESGTSANYEVLEYWQKLGIKEMEEHFIAGATWQREQLAKELCKGCYWEENKPLTPVCDLCRVTKSNYTSYEHSIAKTKTEECNG